MAEPNWQVTATTIYCDAVDDDVTILVYKDGTARCAAYKKYLETPSRQTLKDLQKRSRKLNRQLKCEGPLDHRVTKYRDSVLAREEGGKP